PAPGAAEDEAKEEEKKGEATDTDKQAALKRAQEIRARLLAGEDFAKLAGEVSDDKISKKKGGSMGPVSKADKRLARRGLEKAGELAFTLKKGDVSEPIEGKKGYHIIKVNEDPQVIPFDEAVKMIRFQVQKTAKDDILAELKKKADVKFLEKEPEAPAPVAVPTPAPGAEAPPPPPAAPEVFYKEGTLRKAEEPAPAPAPAEAAPVAAPESPAPAEAPPAAPN
ncbi:MAG: peptidylprolyl isomerase, partial [Deltaproteobacteria bacterium]|nr:peptidylprolyl isomerase [Deltaproteobacteria bacterium]